MNQLDEQINESEQNPFIDTLPLGIVTNKEDPVDGWVRHYVLRELSSGDTKKIHDHELVRTSPMDWMARILALSLESIGDEPIYDAYVRSNYREIPKVLFDLTMADVPYLIVHSHINSYGPVIPDMRFVCPSCRMSNDLAVDLMGLEVTRATSPITEINVELKSGFVYRGEHPTLMGRTFKSYKLRVPTLRDFHRQQSRFTKPNSDVNAHILRSIIVDVQDTEGGSMEKDAFSMLGTRIIEEISAKDYNSLSAALNGVPGIDRRVEYMCNNPMCGVQNRQQVDTSFFFPRG